MSDGIMIENGGHEENPYSLRVLSIRITGIISRSHTTVGQFQYLRKKSYENFVSKISKIKSIENEKQN